EEVQVFKESLCFQYLTRYMDLTCHPRYQKLCAYLQQTVDCFTHYRWALAPHSRRLANSSFSNDLRSRVPCPCHPRPIAKPSPFTRGALRPAQPGGSCAL